MKILFLGDKRWVCKPVYEFLLEEGETVGFVSGKISAHEVKRYDPDIIVSYNYAHILSKEIIDYPKHGVVNLHISYLPWNCGQDPNFWSHLESTPKGVTIHYIDEGVDTGDIIVQRKVFFPTNVTLRTSYEKLQSTIQELFREVWPQIKKGNAPRKKQIGTGTHHFTHDIDEYKHLLNDGWNTPIEKLKKIKLKHENAHGHIVVCAYRPWSIDIYKKKIQKLGYRFHLISSPDELNLENLGKLRPGIIFFMDWSWVVSEDILSKYFCVNFHCANLPDFRGGSPIQNQIIRGIRQTKLTAIKMDEGIDTGDILLKEDLSLEGNLGEIWERIVNLEANMIPKILKGDYKMERQGSGGSYYKRRTPKESCVPSGLSGRKLYDFIRMLDAEGYPPAFMEFCGYRLEFKNARLKGGKVLADVKIKEKR